eukprot:CAMPEP_0113459520 /NCGR_PEP_ID=MMETSP0014_2-20120614/10495_1 /TAXON_ID=2857 /ORGANISM="Nitzschia sp." /LENGTH=246 /DNA_ID=CAMNT_0000351107 /DNA_START=79 /DNA_END=819 /DNA_ORIENTATION=+ /assembly_acc=CAM_ASM_000159
MRRSQHQHHRDGSIDRNIFSATSLCYCLVSVCSLMVVVSVSASSTPPTTFVRTTSPTAFLSSDSSTVSQSLLRQLRGGDLDDADAATEIEFESSDEEEDEESDDEEEEEASLAKSAKAATAKVQAKAQDAAVSAAKSSLKTALQAKKAQSKKSMSSKEDAGGIMSLFTIPYIIKATLNPVTFMKMTKLYWSSLFNHNYLKENTDVSDELRNSQTRNRGSGGGGKKGKRKFKPGQAKTLSDLPALPT